MISGSSKLYSSPLRIFSNRVFIFLLTDILAMGQPSAINKFLGEISYPIYITHYPLIYMQMSWVDSHKDAPLGTHIFVAVCIFVLAILVAYGAYRLYDLPVREWLKKKLFKTNGK